ncbi:MAG: cysteine desulfurase family protein [Nanoarchaeota archaeon]
MKNLYLDSASSTSVDSRVLKAMESYFSVEYGNPSSPHALGEKASKAITISREIIARKINAKPHEIVFTSGTSESDSWVFQGLARTSGKKKILISALEHAAVMESCEYMKSMGYKIVKIPVDTFGVVNLSFIEGQLRKYAKEILVVSVMHVNNVIGVIEPISEIGKLCKRYGVLFHTDVAQSFAKLKIDVRGMNIDLLSASAHKINGPKGIGMLYIRDGIKIEPLIFGGGQERNLRGGTENVAGIVGFARAVECFDSRGFSKIGKIKNYLIGELEELGAKINSPREGIANIVHCSFLNLEGRLIVTYLSGKGIYISSGSACDSKSEKEDESLRAIGLSNKMIAGSLRISLDSSANLRDIDRLIGELKKAIKIFRV